MCNETMCMVAMTNPIDTRYVINSGKTVTIFWESQKFWRVKRKSLQD